eukprot:CAMPEP_0117595430 /NCGR_PEP_ID=MMETSP0784-20121206/73756_1 /TAXON_ID=39447 /ORGANISM="" /LENGTH=405 /DNA_ID=CAMNT_0005397607 /DNA_START=101 /DNA_END=1315 /DNA_ORIENTATION=+
MPRRASARKAAATVRLCLALRVVASAGTRVVQLSPSESNRAGLVQMQNDRRRRGFAEGVAEHSFHASARTLAIVRPSQSLKADLAVNVSSIIPVFSKSESFIAFLFDSNHMSWVDSGIYCASEDGKHRSEVTMVRGNIFLWRCDWPAEEWERPCHTVVLEKGFRGSHFESLGTFETCHDAALYSNASYRLAACVPLVWEDADFAESGIMHLAPWLEYGVMHGVDQFVFYALPDTDPRVKEIMEPYFQQGLATQVVVDTNGMPYAARDYSAQQLLGHDCLYRMRHRAEWLMPYIDTDEYIHFNTTNRTSFPAIMSEIVAREESKRGLRAHSLSFERVMFEAPKASQEKLQIAAAVRKSLLENFPCPKYVVKPHLVHTLGIHWTTTSVPRTFTLSMPPASMAAYHYR